MIALGLYIRWDNVGLGMPACPLGSTHVQTTSGVTCHNLPWAAYTVGGHLAWNAIIALGQHR